MDIFISPLIIPDCSGRCDRSVQSFSIQLLNPLISAETKCLGGNHCFSFSLCSTASLHLQKLLRYSSVSKRREKDTQTKSALLVTKSWFKNRQNFKYNFLQLKCQQQTLQLQMPNVLGKSVYTAGHRQHEYSPLSHKPLAHKSLLEKRQCLYWQSPVHQTLVSPVPIHSSKGEHSP